MSNHVIVIGGGIGGLAAAVRLAARGVRVTLLEKNDRVGGKLNTWLAPHPRRPNDRPFRFDTGPSLLTMPFVFMDLFAAAHEDVRNHLKIIKLDPVARYSWPDGAHLDLRASGDELLLEIRRFAPGDVFGFKRLMQRGHRNWNLGESFLNNSPDQLMKSGKGNGALGGLGMLTLPFRLGMFTKYAKVIDAHIKHPRLRDVLYQYATYSGASPWRAPATLAVIPWVEHYFGGWHIEGGMYRLAEQLESIAQRLGVQIHTNAPVEQILIESAPPSPHSHERKSVVASGVKLRNGTDLRADAIICNCDVVYAYRTLIPSQFRKKYPDTKLNHLDPGGSGIVIMLGVEGTYPQLHHHTKFMPADYRGGDLDAMFETHTLPRDPCIYVCAPTRTDPTLAPAGCESLFILASAPSLRESKIDWQIEGRRYRDRIFATLETRFGLQDLSKRILVERTMTPLDLEHQYNANAGSIYGIASNSLRSAFLRPPNRNRDISRLYFAGGATHPGGGLPLVALSGKIVSEMVVEDLGVNS